MTQCPEVAAVKAIAVAGDMRVISESADEIYVGLGRDTTLLLQRENSDAREDPDPAAPWILQFEFAVRPGKLATEPADLAEQLAAALTAVARVIAKAAPRQ